MKKIFVCIVIVALSVMFVNVSAVSAHREPVKRCTKFEKKFFEYGLTPVDTFSYIAWRESRCRIKAINIIYNADGSVKWALNKNGTFDSGILQINSFIESEQKVQNPLSYKILKFNWTGQAPRMSLTR